MYPVLDCIRYQHDYRLVLLAVAICALTSWTAWSLYGMSARSAGLIRWAWILKAAVATGSGIWATHFIAMLAFKAALPTTYEPLLTRASLLIAICVSGVGFCIAEGDRPRRPMCSPVRWSEQVLLRVTRNGIFPVRKRQGGQSWHSQRHRRRHRNQNIGR